MEALCLFPEVLGIYLEFSFLESSLPPTRLALSRITLRRSFNISTDQSESRLIVHIVLRWVILSTYSVSSLRAKV